MIPKSVSVVLFERFELLDVFGPVSLLSGVPGVTITYLGHVVGPIRSAQGAEVIATATYDDAVPADIVLVPGGIGTRLVVSDGGFLAWLNSYAAQAGFVTSVCTGSGILAAAGLLEGFRATSNKRAFAWASSQGTHVEWVPQARWVEDQDRWTSSGVAAGMDMTAALIRRIWGDDAASEAANRIELDVHSDPGWDPFAALNGLG